MRLRHVEVFHAVYSSGSITAAAKILSVTQPSISKVLAHAEQDLGYALFERVRGTLIPTPEAHRLFNNVATVYQDMEQLRRLARNLRSSARRWASICCRPQSPRSCTPTAKQNSRLRPCIMTRSRPRSKTLESTSVSPSTRRRGQGWSSTKSRLRNLSYSPRLA